MIYQFKNFSPKIHETAFLAPGCMIIGDVEIGAETSVWFGTVIRGDVNHIRIGERVNIQDLSMLHVTREKFPLLIGNDVTIAHKVMLHGCILHDHAFIGMNAVVMDGAEIGEYSIVAAGSLVTQGKKIPPRSLVMGSPAKVIREINEKEENMIVQSVTNYLNYSNEYKLEGF